MWRTELPGYGRPLAVAGTRLAAALGGTGTVAGLAGVAHTAVAQLDALPCPPPPIR